MSAIERVELALDRHATFAAIGVSNNDLRELLTLAKSAGQGDVVERWLIQFSNTPPSVTIWAAKPNHEPRNRCIAYLESGSHRHAIGEAFANIIREHNEALAAVPAGAEMREALNAFRKIVETAMRDEAAGYHSSFRTYVLEMARPHMSALATPASTEQEEKMG